MFRPGHEIERSTRMIRWLRPFWSHVYPVPTASSYWFRINELD